MRKFLRAIKDSLITIAVMSVCFCFCLLIQEKFETSTLISAIFVFGVFITSVLTKGYIYGVIFALVSVLAVNFAFTFPYFAFDFSVFENILSAIILLTVAIITCGLTATIKRHEAAKAEAEIEKMRANLLRAISHDLRTPLTTICGTSSAVLDHYAEFSDQQKQKMITNIRDDSQWLYRMVENLLSITRLDGENVSVIKTETVLDELVDSILVKFAKRYPNVDVTVEIPDDFVLVPMDALLIEQVIINLLDNAVEHAEGMTKLIFRVSIVAKKAIFEVIDDGCGIPEDKIKNIFTNHFHSGSPPSDGKKHNAGIGLSVCASIIKAHGGEIKATNLTDGGCSFKFTLDIKEDGYEQ